MLLNIKVVTSLSFILYIALADLFNIIVTGGYSI